MCLALMQTETADTRVRKARDKIGLGLVLSRETDGIWVYNRSCHPIFVNHLAVVTASRRTSKIQKLHPGCSLRIFDYSWHELLKRTREAGPGEGPSNPYCAQISFIKGWGPNYSRQTVIQCPCWIEILLHVNRWEMVTPPAVGWWCWVMWHCLLWCATVSDNRKCLCAWLRNLPCLRPVKFWFWNLRGMNLTLSIEIKITCMVTQNCRFRSKMNVDFYCTDTLSSERASVPPTHLWWFWDVYCDWFFFNNCMVGIVVIFCRLSQTKV